MFENFKLKVECDQFETENFVQTDYFLSFSKSGVKNKYDKSKSVDDMNFSYVLMSEDSGYMQPDEMHIDEIFVEEKKRGTGLAKELMKRAISFAKEKGKTKICLHPYSHWCGTDIAKLEHFYRSFGFEYQDGKDMVLNLS